MQSKCEAWWHSRDGDDHMRWPHVMMIKCSTWKRRKRKTKPYRDQGKGINRDFVLVIKTLESVITFRIDGHTFKRGS